MPPEDKSSFTERIKNLFKGSSKDRLDARFSKYRQALTDLSDVLANAPKPSLNRPPSQFQDFVWQEDIEYEKKLVNRIRESYDTIIAGLEACWADDYITVFDEFSQRLAAAEKDIFCHIKEKPKKGDVRAFYAMARHIDERNQLAELDGSLSRVIRDCLPIAHPLTDDDYAELTKAIGSIPQIAYESMLGRRSSDDRTPSSGKEAADAISVLANAALSLPRDPVCETHSQFKFMREHGQELHRRAWFIRKSRGSAGVLSAWLTEWRKCSDLDESGRYQNLLVAMHRNRDFLSGPLVSEAERYKADSKALNQSSDGQEGD